MERKKERKKKQEKQTKNEPRDWRRSKLKRNSVE
jgi:hypothetical protein